MFCVFFQIGAHCYYLNESPPSESLDGLIEFFVKGLDCLVQQKSKVTEENAKKGFENILYVRELLILLARSDLTFFGY